MAGGDFAGWQWYGYPSDEEFDQSLEIEDIVEEYWDSGGAREIYEVKFPSGSSVTFYATSVGADEIEMMGWPIQRSTRTDRPDILAYQQPQVPQQPTYNDDDIVGVEYPQPQYHGGRRPRTKRVEQIPPHQVNPLSRRNPDRNA